MARGRKRKPENEGMPTELVCSVCKLTKKTNAPQFRKQVEKSGLTPEEFIESYRCRSCRKSSTSSVHRIPRTTSTTSTTSRSSDTSDSEYADYVTVPNVLHYAPKPPKKSAGNLKVCWDQPLFYKNDRHCDGCIRYEICQVHCKKLTKGAQQKRQDQALNDAGHAEVSSETQV